MWQGGVCCAIEERLLKIGLHGGSPLCLGATRPVAFAANFLKGPWADISGHGPSGLSQVVGSAFVWVHRCMAQLSLLNCYGGRAFHITRPAASDFVGSWEGSGRPFLQKSAWFFDLILPVPGLI